MIGSALIAIGLAGIIALALPLMRSSSQLPPSQRTAQIESSSIVALPEAARATSAVAAAVDAPGPNVGVKPYGPPGRYRLPAKASPYPAKLAVELPAATAPSLLSVRLNPDNGSAYDKVLLNLLAQAPEVALHEPFARSMDRKNARETIAKSLKETLAVNQAAKEDDAFIKKLLDTRADLDGLPFLLGKACRLESAAATRLAVAAALVRGPGGGGPSRITPSRFNSRVEQESYPFSGFWYSWTSSKELNAVAERLPERGGRNTTWDINAAHVQTGIAALTQILSGEEAALRKALVLNLSTQQNPLASKTLAKFAVFDADHDVRELALAGLRYRRFDEYSGELTAAIRYPWAPAARHAATAIVRLDVKETIPSLINFLQEPDPAAPFAVDKKGKQVFAVRELVRVNHHRNCQLCHAPADTANRDNPGQVLATVPSPVEPLPPSISLEYYGWQRSPVVAVRADTTYLRQDFSAQLPVSDAKPWPDMQRFDFMVRTRTLGAEETAMRVAHANAKCSSPQHEAALTALRHLTGLDLGPDAAAWRQFGQGQTADSRGASKPAW